MESWLQIRFLCKTSDTKTKLVALKVKKGFCYWPDGGLHQAVVQLVIVELSKEREEHLDSPDGVDGAVDGVAHRGLHVLPGPNDTRRILVKMPPELLKRVGQTEMDCEGDGPVAWGRAASARRWRRSPWARTPGRAARRWLWRCTWRRWRWPACRRTAPACDARPGRCRSLTWTWRCSAKRGSGAKGRN